jgi:hypothetical protein
MTVDSINTLNFWLCDNARSLNEHLRQLRSLTRGSPLADQLALPHPDQDWLTQNVGGWLFAMFDHQ